jgi:hypothetical protein
MSVIVPIWLLWVGCVHARADWSPDGKWFAYTMAVQSNINTPAPGWLFAATSNEAALGRPTIRSLSAPPTRYRIWATRAITGASVLLEDSPRPLTEPAWSPAGNGLAYERLTPGADGALRFELVIQTAVNRRRVVVSRPLPDPEAPLPDLPALAPAWSPDGSYLAVPWLQQTLDLAIVRVDSGRVVKIIEDASRAVWSPDGSKLAFIRGTHPESVEVIDLGFGPPRQLAEIGQCAIRPIWSRDGRSLLVVSQPGTRGAQAAAAHAELVRVALEPKAVDTVVLVAAKDEERERRFLGVSVTATRNVDTLFYAANIAGEPSEIVWFVPKNSETYKRFNPVEHSVRMSGLSVAPTEPMLAFRAGVPGAASVPGVVDLTTDRLRATAFVPDESARVEWLVTLIDAARGLLVTVLTDPAVTAPGVERPTLLPIPGELEEPGRDEVRAGLRELARLGRPLCTRPPDASPEPMIDRFLDEARLFFDYLQEDYAAAFVSAQRIEPGLTRPDQRLKLISLRAQIQLGQRDFAPAFDTIDFLRSRPRLVRERIEDTPGGPVVTRLGGPGADRSVPRRSAAGRARPGPGLPGTSWTSHLARRATELEAKTRGAHRAGDDEPDPFQNPIMEPPPIDLFPGQAPFAPAPVPGQP